MRRLAIICCASLALSGCATQKWSELDDKQCRAWGATGDQYDLCRDALNKKRWREIGEAFDQIGQGAGQIASSARPQPTQPIIPPCIDCKVVYRNY